MIRASIAFLASILTAVQAGLLFSEKSGVCFNDGCAVVDSLTRVDPIYFNLAGFLFFQTVFWLFFIGYKKVEYGNKLARLALLAGMASEAVLIFFQYSIAQTFCSYCLIIFSFILVLNILSGLRQIFRAFAVFTAVLVACFSLSFGSATSSGETGSLESGSIAVVEQSTGEQGERYLFFSSTCPHCEEVIEELRRDNQCGIRFNPIDTVEGFTFPGAMIQAEYDAKQNLRLLKGLGITEVPVLLVEHGESTEILRGKNAILAELDRSCRSTTSSEVDYSGSSEVSSADFMYGQQPEEDGCKLEEACEDDGSSNSSSSTGK